MRRSALLFAVTGFAIALAVVAIGSLLLGGGDRDDRFDPAPPLARKPEKRAAPAPRLVPLPARATGGARAREERPPAAPELPPEPAPGDLRGRIAALLREYDQIINETSGSGPADADRISTLRERQQRLDKLVAELAALGPEAVPILIDLVRGDAHRPDLIGRQTILVRAIARIPGPEALAALGDALAASESYTLKMTLVTQLAENRGSEGIEILSRRIHLEADPRVRSRILTYLGRQKSPEAVLLISRVAQADPDPNVRIAAIRALGEAADPGTVPLLESIARTAEDVGCRQNAIQIYARLARDTSIPTLEDLLRNDPNLRIRAVAILALQEVGGERARAALEAAANDPGQSEDVRARARGALAALEREARAAASGQPAPSFDRKLEGLRPIDVDGIRTIPALDGKR